VDPDSYGVPIVSAATDVIGAVAVIAVLALFALR
jgi:cation transporter-like permease